MKKALVIALAATTVDAAPFRAFAVSPSQAAAGLVAGTSASADDAARHDPDKVFADTVQGMQQIAGLFTIYRAADDSRVLMEIAESQLDQVFLLAATVDRGTGERGLYASQALIDYPFVLRKQGNNIQLVRLNTRFIADDGTPQARGIKRSFPEAIVGSARIQVGPRPSRQSVLIDVADLFVTDLPGLTQNLGRAYEPTIYGLDRAASAITAIRNFPQNTLLHVRLHFVTDNPRAASVTLPDRRSIPLTVAYDLFPLRHSTYQPRAADDRIGHFFVVQQDFTSDEPSAAHRRSIARWHLEKADPSAPLSVPRQPIVFWIENTVPVDYRPYFAEGVLVWNKAFERIGFRDTLEVRQQPDEAEWDAADARYSTIRWFAGADTSAAAGPIRGNPFTGEIYDADIVVSVGIIRGARGQVDEVISTVLPNGANAIVAGGFAAESGILSAAFECQYAHGLADQAAFALELLQARPAAPDSQARLMREYLVNLVAHEVGHALGLRHNFRGSTALSLTDVHDRAKTEQAGQSGSLMDYHPVIIAGRGQPQGHFLPVSLGAYDYWAIEYAYKVIAGDELSALSAIAARAGEPGLAYATDEDTGGQNPAAGIDPMVNQYDQSADPLAFFRERTDQIHEVWRSMEARLARPGEAYQILRRSLNRSLADYSRTLLGASKSVGGIHHRRAHVDDPGGLLPFTAVPAERQREALEFLRDFGFSEDAFQLPPTLHRKLAVERLRGIDVETYTASTQRINYPYHDVVLEIQQRILSQILHAATLSRIVDSQYLAAGGETPFTLAELFQSLNAGIWSELSNATIAVSSVRRNLQREHLRQLTRLAVRQAEGPRRPAGAPIPIDHAPIRTPDDARSLALSMLRDIQGRTRGVLAAGSVSDVTTRAHLAGVDAQIDAVLRAQLDYQVD